jgi:hypothetical protein
MKTSWTRDTLGPHLAGQLLGGAALGLALAAGGSLLHSVAPVGAVTALVAVTVAAYAAAELAGRSLWRPDTGRQVPDGFRKTPYHRTMAFLWGLDLGFGWSTRQPSSGVLTACLGALMLAADAALLVGIAFALSRGLTLLVGWRATDIRDAERRFDAFRARPRVARFGSAASGALVLAGAVIALG